jgi:hypothetical protein
MKISASAKRAAVATTVLAAVTAVPAAAFAANAPADAAVHTVQAALAAPAGHAAPAAPTAHAKTPTVYNVVLGDGAHAAVKEYSPTSYSAVVTFHGSKVSLDAKHTSVTSHGFRYTLHAANGHIGLGRA